MNILQHTHHIEGVDIQSPGLRCMLYCAFEDTTCTIQEYLKHEQSIKDDIPLEDDISEWLDWLGGIIDHLVTFKIKGKTYQLIDYFEGDAPTGFIIRLPTNSEMDYIETNVVISTDWIELHHSCTVDGVCFDEKLLDKLRALND